MADDDGIGGRVDSPLYYNGEVSDLSDQVDTDYLGLPAVSDGESEISDFNSKQSEEYLVSLSSDGLHSVSAHAST